MKTLKMYKFLLSSLLLLIVLACNTNNKERTHEQLIHDYFHGLNTLDFALVSNCVTDSMENREMEFIISHSQEEMYELFQWDSIFNPTLTISDIVINENKAQLTMTKTCPRIRFLQDSATVCVVHMEFEDHLISKIETTEYLYFDVPTWSSRRDTLVSWVDQHHPELTGFIYDISANGAQNYLKAIKLYQDKNQK